MNNTRANRAAADIAKAVQNVARTAAQPQPETVTATVVYRNEAEGGAPAQIEVDGVLFVPREDQAEYRRQKRTEAICNRLAESGGAGAELLLGELEQLWHERVQDAVYHRMYKVACRLIEVQLGDLFERIYADWLEGSVYEPGDGFRWFTKADADRGSYWTA